MNGPTLRPSDFRAHGIDPGSVARLVRSGDIQRLRRGGYVDQIAPDARQRHLQLLAATYPLLGVTTVVSHWSAAALHGLPLWTSDLAKVSVTRPPGSHGNRAQWVHTRACPVSPEEVDLIEGMRVTTLARTAVDLARCNDFERAVAVMDAALHQGLPKDDLMKLVSKAPRRYGIVCARRAAEFSEPLSESVGESRSRVVFDRWGLPKPELQFSVFSPGGVFIARSDFGWPEFRVLGEFDGLIKYAGTLKSGESGVEAFAKEKQREEAIRDAGWIIVRWMWDDLAHPAQLAQRLNSAFAQGRRVQQAS